MGVAGRSAHFEDDVHERRRLRDLPVDARRGRARGHLAQVDDEVAHAPEEVVLVDIPLRPAAARDVRVRVCAKNKTYSALGTRSWPDHASLRVLRVRVGWERGTHR